MLVGFEDKNFSLPKTDVRRKFRAQDANELKNVTNSNWNAIPGLIQAAIDALIGGAPGALNTLNELAEALSDDAAFATTVTNALATRLITANIVKRETPSGAVPGSSFTTAFPLVAGSEELFRNGQLLDYTTSYTMTGQNISLVLPLESWESLKINYIKS